MADATELLRRLYAGFNARDIEATLTGIAPDVEWANAMEGGHVRGHAGIRSYWTRQWTMVDPHVDPVSFARGAGGEIVVDVHQIVRDLTGTILFDGTVSHIFHLENGLVRRFDVR